MDKRRLANIERAVRQKTGRSGYPPPGFFDTWEEADGYRESLLREGWPLEKVDVTPVFIMDELAD
jgi:hypothetical protein